MLAGGNLNDVRRRYQLDTEFGEDSPCHSPSKTELEMLKKALAISKEPEYYADEKAQAPIDGEDAAIAMLANAASNIVAPGPRHAPGPRRRRRARAGLIRPRPRRREKGGEAQTQS
jgi:hypothetical protein